jgi:hypothetical protein
LRRYILIVTCSLAVLIGMSSGSVVAESSSEGWTPAKTNAAPIACWYNANRKFTSANEMGPGAVASAPVITGRGGDCAWRSIIKAPDGRSCPQPDMTSPPLKDAHFVMCWYGTNRQYTAADEVYPGAPIGGPFNTGHHDDTAWVFTIPGADGHSCPHAMPAAVDPNTIHLVEDRAPGPKPGLVTCFYNTNRKYVGAESANPNVSAGGPVSTKDGGDRAWAYTIAAPDGRSCPHPDMPAPR